MSEAEIAELDHSMKCKELLSGFHANYSLELFRACSTVVYPNRRSASMGAQVPQLFEKLRRRFNPLSPETSHRYNMETAETELAETLKSADAFSRVYDGLFDDESRKTLIRVLLHRCLSARHSPPISSENEFWQSYDDIDTKFLVKRGTKTFWQWKLNQYQIPGRNGPIHLHGTPGHVLCEFINPQYRIEIPGFKVETEDGDVVVDGGGCFGDTALYFADRCGKLGTIHSFEFVESSLKLFHENLSLNPILKKRISIVKKALSVTSGEAFRYSDNGPGTTSTASGEYVTTTGTIDELQASLKGQPISFIKLDIEGAELDAIQGARKTLCEFKPKLAIAVYHCLEHLHAVQNYIADLDLGYKFCLRHFTPGPWETVLFANAM